MSTKRALIAALVSFVAGTGCTEHMAYREGGNATERFTATPERCPELQAPSQHTVPIGYVEIDEQGYFFDRHSPDPGKVQNGQVERVLELVKADGKHKYVVVFVHGWFHSAREGDPNVERFKCALNNLQAIQGEGGEQVIGVYIGWRGKSVAVPGLALTTFWDRKNTSEEIGRGSFVEFLMRLEGAVKPDKDSQNKLMLVGHSFGASVVFNSIGQILLARFVLDAEKLASQGRGPTHAQSKPDLISGYGDLVVLVNPAIEATRIWPFFSALNYYTSGKVELLPAQPPRLVVLSSEGDNATRTSFPIARFFSTIFESYKDPSEATPYGKRLALNQRQMDWQTMGNIGELQTHAALHASEGKWDGKCPRAAPDWLPRAIEQRKSQQKSAGELDTGVGWAQVFGGRRIKLQHLGVTTPSNPLWIMAVGRELIAEHSGIADPGMICFFDQLMGDPATVKREVQEEQRRKQ